MHCYRPYDNVYVNLGLLAFSLKAFIVPLDDLCHVSVLDKLSISPYIIFTRYIRSPCIYLTVYSLTLYISNGIFAHLVYI